MSKPNIIEMKGNLGGLALLKGKEGTCAECAVAHPPDLPHDQQSLHWQYRFKEQHGRWPTWHDAMRHCTAEMKDHWLQELSTAGVALGVDIVERDHANVRMMIAMGARALSVRQPWAWLIVHGHKKFENREWSPQNPARMWLQRTLAEWSEDITVLIHAAQGMTRDEYASALAIAEDNHITLPLRADLERGGIVGVAKLVRWHEQRPAMPFAFGSGIEIGFTEAREFLPCKGALGFFKPVLESEVAK